MPTEIQLTNGKTIVVDEGFEDVSRDLTRVEGAFVKWTLKEAPVLIQKTAVAAAAEKRPARSASFS